MGGAMSGIHMKRMEKDCVAPLNPKFYVAMLMTLKPKERIMLQLMNYLRIWTLIIKTLTIESNPLETLNFYSHLKTNLDINLA